MMARLLILLLLSLALLAAGVTADVAVTLSGMNAGMKETELGDVVADAVRDAAGADLAIVHAMAFRPNAAIDKGAVHADNAPTLLRLDKNVATEQAFRACLTSPTTKIVTLSLTPASLYAVMKRATAKLPEKNVAFLHVAGLTVKMQDGKVKELIVDAKTLDPTDTKTTFTVAMPLDLALGAATYIIEFNDTIRKSMVIKPVTLLDACVNLAQSETYVVKSPRLLIEK